MKKNLILAIIFLLMVGIFVILNVNINNAHRERDGDYPSKDEFVRTINCAELFDSNPPGTCYIVSFDLKAKAPGKVKVYPQNGDTFRYSWEPYPIIEATEEYVHYEIEIEPILMNDEVEDAYIAFYSKYGSGVIPAIKNIEIKPK